MAEDLKKAARAFAEKATTGLVGLAAAAAGGPDTGVVATAAMNGVFDYVRALGDLDSAAVTAGRIAAFEQELRRVADALKSIEERLERSGRKFDRQDFFDWEGTFSDFAKAVSEARTPEKRLALVNAAAHQFDPSAGAASARTYWFSIIRKLDDIELRLISLIAEHKWIAFDGAAFAVSLQAGTAILIPDIGIDEVVALENTGLQAPNESTLGRLVSKRGENLKQVGSGKQWSTTTFALTPAGECVARMIAD